MVGSMLGLFMEMLTHASWRTLFNFCLRSLLLVLFLRLGWFLAEVLMQLFVAYLNSVL